LCSPETSNDDADRLVEVFGEWMQLVAANRASEEDAA